MLQSALQKALIKLDLSVIEFLKCYFLKTSKKKHSASAVSICNLVLVFSIIKFVWP